MLTKLTPTLEALLRQYDASARPEANQRFVAHIEKLSKELDDKLDRLPPGPIRARAIHALIEEATTAIGDIKPSCYGGCSACCHLEVEITLDEGVVLAELVRAGHPIDRERLAAQAQRERKSPEWANMMQPSNRCVFLGDDKRCSIYSHRPAACRKLLVISHPAECGTLDGKVNAVTIPMAEVILSTVISRPDTTFMSLSKSLTKGLDEPAPTG